MTHYTTACRRSSRRAVMITLAQFAAIGVAYTLAIAGILLIGYVL